MNLKLTIFSAIFCLKCQFLKFIALHYAHEMDPSSSLGVAVVSDLECCRLQGAPDDDNNSDDDFIMTIIVVMIMMIIIMTLTSRKRRCRWPGWVSASHLLKNIIQFQREICVRKKYKCEKNIRLYCTIHPGLPGRKM